MDSYNLKEEVFRAFILSQSLEPLADKPGCTTRHVDSSPGTKLEYFTISAVNSAWPMVELVERIVKQDGQPECVFDVAYEAQRRSTRNRYGGKVNYAQILMLLPIITAQCLLFVEHKIEDNVYNILERITPAMLATTSRDVFYLQRLVDLATELSQEHHRRRGTTRQQLYPHFVGVYSNVMEATGAEGFSHTMMATEIRDGYPQCRQIFEDLSDRGNRGLLEQSEIVYAKYLPILLRHDIVADCLVVAFYLVLINEKTAILFP